MKKHMRIYGVLAFLFLFIPLLVGSQGTSASLSNRLPAAAVAPLAPGDPLKAPSAVYTVDTTSDANLTACTDAANDDCSLRGALNNANSGSGADTINFAIPGSGVQTITPLTALPTIVYPVVIDGYTQPGSSCNNSPIGDNASLLINLDGNNLFSSGLTITAGGSTVRGLIISSFSLRGISLLTNGGNKIMGNYIGTNAAGTQARGNGGTGVYVEDAPNNYIGTYPTSPNLLCDRNLISANGQNGVLIGNPLSTGNIVQNNYIGTKANGTEALGNTNTGVLIQSASNNLIGGIGQGLGNVISSNIGHGVWIAGGSTNNQVFGNLIGTDAFGTGPLGNTAVGVSIQSASNNLIGGTSGVTLGGPCTGACNRIAYNGFDGVRISVNNSTGNTISANSIHDNGLGIGDLGIDLNNNGVTNNDLPCDADTGPNQLQNFPDISSATTNGTSTTVQWTFNGVAGSGYILEFFASVTADTSGHGEGEIYLGAAPLVTVPTGCAVGISQTTLNVGVPAGYYIAATTTNNVGNTSEFSGWRQVQLVATNTPTTTATFTPTATIQPHTATATVTLTATIQTVTATATVTQPAPTPHPFKPELTTTSLRRPRRPYPPWTRRPMPSSKIIGRRATLTIQGSMSSSCTPSPVCSPTAGSVTQL